MERKGPYADFLSVVEGYEEGDWETVTRLAPKLGLSTVEVPEAYLEAVNWSREQVSRAA